MKKIKIENIKNLKSMEFVVPAPGLYVLTGKNGSGKTTLFTCLSRICNSNAYRSGFPSTSNNPDYDVFAGSISYIVDDNIVKYSRRTNGEWRPNVRNSNVFSEFGYPMVVNITTKNERVFSQEVIKPRRRGNNTDSWLNEKLNQIFETNKFDTMIKITTGDLRRGRATNVDARRRNIAYAIPIPNNKFYTELNFSFGEIVMINLLHDIKSASNGSLILIDELELALHPSAQIKLVTILRELAKDKGLTILISTHSSSIIKAERSVTFFETLQTGEVKIIYNCPPAKAIGAIGMREDTDPDIVVLVEDNMARALFFVLMQRYKQLCAESNYLDIRILEIGGYDNVINFYIEAKNYIFYDNTFLSAFLDKDVETDIISYRQFSNQSTIANFNSNRKYMHFLPYTPEVLLAKALYCYKEEVLEMLISDYANQQLNYNMENSLDFANYETDLPQFNDQDTYNAYIKKRGDFRDKCKKCVKMLASEISAQINISCDEIYRKIFKLAADKLIDDDTIRVLLAPTMKRIK